MKKFLISSFCFGIIIGIFILYNIYPKNNSANVQRFLKLGEDITSNQSDATKAFTTMAFNARDVPLCLSVIKKTLDVTDETGECICDVTKKFHNEIIEKCK